ncbi:MAG: type II secretion system protein [Tepidisphaeraceae bacterium]|jgi:type II secretory pathway pseudopilin PulG
MNRLRRNFGGFTLTEMLTTVAVLIILLGLMVSLARHVRLSASDQLTRDILHRLDEAMAVYIHLNDEAVPDIPPFIDDSHGLPGEAALQRSALVNNESFVRILNSQGLLSDRVSDLSIEYYDDVHVFDAWGSPIVFMAKMHPAVGMNAKGWFFFSAGPDGRYLTRDDNLYSYDQRATTP